MTLQAGKMYRPTDIAIDTANSVVFVVEQFNHRISKWNYTSFIFTLDAGQVTTLSLNNAGSDYVLPTLVFSPPDLDIANPVTATATITETLGVLNAPILTNGGNGYSFPPTVTVVDTTGINGVVTVTAINAPWGSNGDGTTGEGGPIGNGGPTDNSLYRPTGILFRANFLHVLDTFHNRLRSLNATTGAFTASTGKGGFADEDFYHPIAIVVNSTEGAYLITDELNHKGKKYSSASSPVFQTVIDDPSSVGDLSFVRPHGLVYDSQGAEFYNFGDSQRGIISQYNLNGDNYLQQFGTPGTGDDEIFFPGIGHGILTGDTHSVFADTRNNSLKGILNATITTLTGSTPDTLSAGTGDGQLYYPESAVAFSDGLNYVLVANTLNNRVEVFTNAGTVLTFQSNFGSP